MIVGKLKPIEEITSSVSGFKNVMVIGCGSCVSVCLSGGEKAADRLVHALSSAEFTGEKRPEFLVGSILRQCERDLLENYLEVPPGIDAILSLACGAGVQTLTDVFDDIPVIPALNTTFLGALDEPGIWKEKCRGCGDCILVYTGGICPVTRCAKRLLNGPCGGSRGGKCEINRELECAWQLIIDRLASLGRLDEYEKIIPPKNWSADRGLGPRSMIHPD
ncbi:methylenetetrahydrofolate reductase C-terminal domain-containing protein [Thermodesulfobacteriota bacterium]